MLVYTSLEVGSQYSPATHPLLESHPLLVLYLCRASGKEKYIDDRFPPTLTNDLQQHKLKSFSTSWSEIQVCISHPAHETGYLEHITVLQLISRAKHAPILERFMPNCSSSLICCLWVPPSFSYIVCPVISGVGYGACCDSIPILLLCFLNCMPDQTLVYAHIWTIC